MTRRELAERLGVQDRLMQLNHVLDRWRGTSDRWKLLFSKKLGIPLEQLIDIPVRPSRAVFRSQQRRIKRAKAKGVS